MEQGGVYLQGGQGGVDDDLSYTYNRGSVRLAGSTASDVRAMAQGGQRCQRERLF